jgi:hypothetical protein
MGSIMEDVLPAPHDVLVAAQDFLASIERLSTPSYAVMAVR